MLIFHLGRGQVKLEGLRYGCHTAALGRSSPGESQVAKPVLLSGSKEFETRFVDS